jgi:CubicO group peptidase (beta-lactamase class C family)
MYLDRLQELFEASIEHVHGEVPPGTRCDYSPLVNHVLMGTALVRTDPKGRNYQTLLHEDLFAPLGMDSTSMGPARRSRPRHVSPTCAAPSRSSTSPQPPRRPRAVRGA